MSTAICSWNAIGFDGYFDQPSQLVKNLSKNGYLIAGFLVGIGTKLGNGCTSGHGVCGLPRFALRSWIYVPAFLVFGILTASFRDRYPFLVDETEFNGYSLKEYSLIFNCILALSGAVFVGLCGYFTLFKTFVGVFDIVYTAITAVVFALGLIISGMNKRSKIIGFLTLNNQWDSSLLIVLCGAVGLNFLTFYLIRKSGTTQIINNKNVDGRLILGAVLFGVGWGLGGLCPGPAFVLFPFMTPHISLMWFGGLAIGQYSVKMYDHFSVDSKIKTH